MVAVAGARGASAAARTGGRGEAGGSGRTGSVILGVGDVVRVLFKDVAFDLQERIQMLDDLFECHSGVWILAPTLLGYIPSVKSERVNDTQRVESG